jgi:hypothetical protein
MARLKILVDEKNGKTQSKFATNKVDKVVFVNKHTSATLNVTASDPALCQGGQAVLSFDVTVVEQRETFEICKDFHGAEFKYTAQLGSLPIEDPIIIIEHASVIESYGTLLLFAGSAALGLLAGYYFGMRRVRSRTGTPA